VTQTLEVIAILVIACTFAHNGLQLAQLVFAAAHAAWRRAPRRLPVRDSALPKVAILVPAFNEELTIVPALRSLLTIDYPNVEVIVADDGSKDSTLAKLAENFALAPSLVESRELLPHKKVLGVYRSRTARSLTVLTKINGGKADALNAAISLSDAHLICVVDADSLLDRDALRRAVAPFIDDPETLAVGGSVLPLNGCVVRTGEVSRVRAPRALLPALQCVEYMRAFLLARTSFGQAGLLTIISGAFGVFDRTAVIRAGGYSTATAGEDLELVVRLHRSRPESVSPYAIKFVPGAICWTEVPESWRVLAGQRRRWQRGGIQTLMLHRDMFWTSKDARIAWGALSQIVFLDLISPIVELTGFAVLVPCALMGLVSPDYAKAFLALVFAFGVFLGAAALLLERLFIGRFERGSDLAALSAVIALENFGYRQLNTIWRVQGLIELARGRHGWGAITQRTGAAARQSLH
jgi:cellulose synthase/poly-beta-1,6-N-acetylglucosamine synthase-like glycosyltransferase